MQVKTPHQYAAPPAGPMAGADCLQSQKNAANGQIYLELPGKGLVIAPRGALDVEALFRGLPLALSVAGECHELRVDLSQACGLDDLAVSSLVVLMRNYARGFGSIVLKGLPPWAADRFGNIGVDNLLGREWGCGREANEVRYWRWKA